MTRRPKLPTDGDHYAGRPDPVDEAIAAAAQRPLATSTFGFTTGRGASLTWPSDIRPEELLQLIWALIGEAEKLRQAATGTRLIVPGRPT